MKRFLQFILLVFLLSSAVSALYVWRTRRDDAPSAAGKRVPEKYTAAEAPAIDLKDVDILAALSRQQVRLAAAVIPSVVSVATQKAVRQRSIRDPLAELFGMVDPRQRQNRIQSSLGSGVIVSKEGHIVTNNHVIDGMDQIKVRLSDGREFAARLIGAAPQNDLAILKIDAGDLKPLPLGDSDKVEVGEMVFAVGNPFGLEETLTQGIISAKARPGGEVEGEFFQTDAAINPGNSGGALVSVRGDLVGINTAIFSQSGGSQGIGFAIPAATVRRVLESVLKNGRVVRGYLGVTLEEVTPAAAQDLGLKEARGVIVAQVANGSPAEVAGIKPRDVIVKFNDRDVKDIRDLRTRVAGSDVDAKIGLEVIRAGKNVPLSVQMREMPADYQVRVNPAAPPAATPPPTGPSPRTKPPQNAPPSASEDGALPGVAVTELTPRLASRLSLPDDAAGVVVTRVDPDSPAARILREDDVIEEVNQVPVPNEREFQRALSLTPRDRDMAFSIVRERRRSFVPVPRGR